ncbi:MAG TPA: M48 family metallopeptidase [Polyangia bacterium]|nr:M48 family metallopeptidase [Polyangia bacterium]
MADSTRRKQLRTFPGLQAEDFQHPDDLTATAALQAIPGLDTLVAKILEYGFERVYYLENVANNVRVTPRMFERLHKALGWGCKILGVDEPELYVTLNPVPNAYTYGHTRPFIVLTSGLVDMLDDEERFFVIAHELGHIKCGHVLYGMMARNIAAVVNLIGQVTLGLGALLGQGLVLALYDWFRKAELSADRAALLCVQDINPAVRSFMKMAGGASRLYAEMDQGEFVRQIRQYEEADSSHLNRAYKVLLTAYRTHPFPIMRAKELDSWFSSGYRDLAGPRGLLTG